MKKINIIAASLFIAALVVGGGLAASSSVRAQASPGVACTVATASPILAGGTATLVASGGDGSYLWSSPGVVITNPSGTTFSVSFPASGSYPVTVTSAGTSATCTVAVISGPMVEAPAPATPGLPNTGELPV